ncbi:response regulator transcription factor [Antarcticibacterium flavum]|uniref:Response regulator transcription factor n=1 Tax=Antarcticibacterium flavum TaxID=2058175 RepID=A0A5B7X125_9FLAO|nr:MULTISPECIES: response regulator transcription factor [Antarcticibacterium]MCM4159819.1 two-component system response regulator [Antarcticibacterium sp. W02-3]QCY68825.1 response regulator transcription factor [Antarcticibacterium flavum]
MAVKLVIFEDNEKLRNLLKSLFQYNNDYEITGMYENVLDAKKLIEKDRPEVVLLDIDMPGMDGISALPVIKGVDPGISIIMYTQFEDDDKLFKSLCAGADGYILKSTSPMHLFDSIEEVRKGGVPLSPAIARKVLHFFQGDPRESGDKFGLTEREREVLKLLVKGYSIKMIAAELNIAYDTTRSHLRNIYNKLHVNCGKEAIAKILSGRIKF